jgi:hypothetical protein
LVNLPGDVTAVEEVAQLQLFVPNFMDDVIAGISEVDVTDLVDPGTLEQVFGADVPDPLTFRDLTDIAPAGDALVVEVLANLVEMILVDESENGDRPDLIGGVLDDVSSVLGGNNGFYIFGAYGQLPEPYADEDFEPADVELPTTSRLLGIDLGGAQIIGDTHRLEIVGEFLGVADVKFLVDANNINEHLDLPRVGAELVFGSGTSATHAGDQIRGLLTAIGLPPVDPEQPLLPGNLQWLALPSDGLLEGELRAYSPGYELPAEEDDPDSVEAIKRTGGIEAHARLELPGFVDSAAFDFTITPSSGSIPDVDASVTIDNFTAGLPSDLFSADLQMSFSNTDLISGQGAVEAAIDGNVQLAGQGLSVVGQFTLANDEGIYGFAQIGESGGVQFEHDAFSFEGQVTLLVNATEDPARTIDLPHLASGDDPTLGAFGVSLLLDGEVTIAGTTLYGLFQLSADGDTLSLLGSGGVTFDQFQPLLTASTEVTVAAHLQAGTDGFYGAALLEAADSSAFSDGGFTSQSAAVGLAFNNTNTDLSEGVVLPSMDDTSLDISDQRLRDYLEVPKNTFRLFASGAIGFLGLGVSADLMAQADPNTSAVDLVASGDLNLGLLGEVEAFGSLRLDPAGTAGRLDVTGPFNIPDGLEIDGDATFEFNTSNTRLDVLLADEHVLLADEPVAAGPRATLHVGSSGGPATMTLLGVTLSGTADVRISPNAFGLDAGLDLSVEIPKDVSVPEGFPDSIEGASAETTIEFSNGALRQAEFEFSVLGFSVFGQEVHFDVHATLYRSGCLSMSIAGSPFPVQFNVLKGEPSCTPRLYVDDINVIKGEYTAQVPVTVAPPIDEDVRFTFFFENGSAVLGTHYKAVSGFQQGSTIVVPAGQSTVNVPVGILDPSDESGDRSFTFEINSGSLEPEAVKAGTFRRRSPFSTSNR